MSHHHASPHLTFLLAEALLGQAMEAAEVAKDDLFYGPSGSQYQAAALDAVYAAEDAVQRAAARASEAYLHPEVV